MREENNGNNKQEMTHKMYIVKLTNSFCFECNELLRNNILEINNNHYLNIKIETTY